MPAPKFPDELANQLTQLVIGIPPFSLSRID